jgi:rhodanese-related sulfurtransferase
MSQTTRRPAGKTTSRPIAARPTRRPPQALPIIGGILGALILVVLGTYALNTVFAPGPPPATATPDPLAGVPLAAAPTPPWDPDQGLVPRISLHDFKNRFDRKDDMLIVDVRNEPSWVGGHIPGAIVMPVAEMQARIAEMPRNRDIILYCACGAEEESARAGVILVKAGYTRVWALRGGWDAWLAEGYPTDPPLTPVP